MKRFALLGICAMSLALSACSSNDNYSKHEATGGESSAAHKAETKDIVDTAVAAGSFNTLASLLTKAGLVDTLKGEGPFTVFAPTDAAFAKVPQATLEALGENKDLLRKVLTYHVVSGKVMKKTAVTLSEATMVSGDKAKIQLKNGNAYIAGAKITSTDIAASNGVIHVIDSVMMPPK